MLKIYHIDLGYRGSITVVAENKKDALKFMAQSDDFQYSSPTQLNNIEEHEIKVGTFIETYGDR